jgi:hypothetical protein
MLFFRSEERLDGWCAERKVRKQPVVTMAQLWLLASRWYGTRLDATARRPGPDEMRAIFAEIGLTGAFWDPQADRF